MQTRTTVALVFLALAVASCTASLEIHGRIVGGTPAGTRVLLHGKSLSGLSDSRDLFALPMANGSFVLGGVPEDDARYLLQVACPLYEFTAVRVIVCISCTPQIRAEAHNTTRKVAYPLTLVPAAQRVTLRERDGYDVMALFANPMVLLLVVGGGMSLMMGRMTEGLDDATKKELASSPLLKAMAAAQSGDMASILGDSRKDGKKKKLPPAARVKA